MAIQYTDLFGTVIDTGCNTQPAVRANVEIEVHSAGEVDSGSTLTAPTVPAKHIPHRDAKNPR